jgi:hypothetical protein
LEHAGAATLRSSQKRGDPSWNCGRAPAARMSRSHMPLRVQICLLFLLAAASAISAKKLVIFGDSISDDGNGESLLLLTSGAGNA